MEEKTTLPISDLYICSLLKSNHIEHVNTSRSLDGRHVFFYDDCIKTRKIIDAFNKNVEFLTILDGVSINLRLRDFARALRDIKTIIHQ